MQSLTTEELSELLAASEKKEPTSIAGKFKDNYIYSGTQHELIKRMALALIGAKIKETR